MCTLLDCLVEERQWPEVLEWAERWIAVGHVPEPAYRALMLAQSEPGNRARIATVYQRCRELLLRGQHRLSGRRVPLEPHPACRPDHSSTLRPGLRGGRSLA